MARLMTGLIALFNEQYKKPSGFINPLLYSNNELCRDITEGNNKTTSSGEGYSAGMCRDACTVGAFYLKSNECEDIFCHTEWIV